MLLLSHGSIPDEIIARTEEETQPSIESIPKHKKPKKLSRFLSILGPGIVTGAADDDPSGIATYSQAGAQFGLKLPWTMLFTFHL